MSVHAKIGAAGFALWGVLHFVGGGAILIAALREPQSGYAFYPTVTSGYDALSGAILAYFAYVLVCLGAVVMALAWRGNLRNSQTALAINTVMVVLTEIGLIAFLLIPGHVALLDASLGFGFAAIGIIFGGVACTAKEAGHAIG